jgi:CRISPR/Cas system CMR-associated protein Cmr3 (group 5 of RAMP superfamily)
MWNIEWMRLLAKEAKMIEVKSHRFEDGTTLAIFKDSEGVFSVSQFDQGDIELWEMTFDHEHDAWTEFNKRVAEGPVDQRTGAKR